jgi:hypothetical protein
MRWEARGGVQPVVEFRGTRCLLRAAAAPNRLEKCHPLRAPPINTLSAHAPSAIALLRGELPSPEEGVERVESDLEDVGGFAGGEGEGWHGWEGSFFALLTTLSSRRGRAQRAWDMSRLSLNISVPDTEKLASARWEKTLKRTHLEAFFDTFLRPK